MSGFRQGALYERLSTTTYPEEKKEVAGADLTLAPLAEDEHEYMNLLLDKLYFTDEPKRIRQAVLDNENLIIDLVRVVKWSSNQFFRGAKAKGSELSMTTIEAEMFSNVWGGSATNFESNIASTGAKDYIGSSGSPESLSDDEGLLILGFIERVPKPKTNKIQFIKDDYTYGYQTIWFPKDDEKFFELKNPYFLPPRSTFYIQLKAHKTGDVEFVPIGVKVLKNIKLLSL